MTMQHSEKAFVDALTADLQRAAERRHSRNAAVTSLAAMFYTGLQVAANYRRIEEAVPQLQNGIALEQTPLVSWDWTAGIPNAEATTVILGLAALVLTINVAVFASRIGTPSEVRVELELARWQRAMEYLAPTAAAAAAGLTITRMPESPGFAVALAVVSAIAIGASDVRIAGSLNGLRAVEETARASWVQSMEELQRVQQSLPRQAIQPEPLQSSQRYRLRQVARLVGVSLFVAVLQLALIIWVDSTERGTSPGNESAYPSMLLLLLLLDIVCVMMPMGVLLASTYRHVMKKAKVAKPAQGTRTDPISLVLTIAAPLIVAGLFQKEYQWLVAGPMLLAAAAQFLAVMMATRFGRGPGLLVVWQVVAKLSEETARAEANLKYAQSQHEHVAAINTALAKREMKISRMSARQSSFPSSKRIL